MSAKKPAYDPATDPRVTYSDDRRSAKIELQFEVQRGAKDEPLVELAVRRPTVGDLEAADKAGGNVGGSIMVIAAVTGLPIAVVRRLDAEDFTRISAVVEGFGGGNDQATGGAS